MRLRDLHARFVALTSATDRRTFGSVATLAEAHGLWFQCPKCAEGLPVVEENGERFVRGAHYVLCWFRGRGVPEHLEPGPGRWTPSGTGLDDLTFVPGTPAMPASVVLKGGCNWHGWVRNGEATPTT